MEKFKLLLVTNTLGKWGETNGVEYTYNNLLPFFRRDSIPCDVVTYGPADRTETTGSVTIHVHRPRVPLRIDPELTVDLAFGTSRAAGIIRSQHYDLAISAAPDPLGYAASRAASHGGYPLIGVYHTCLDYYARVRVSARLGRTIGEAAGRLTRRVLKDYYDRAVLILAPGQQMKQEIEKYLEPRVEVLSRGIDVSSFDPARRSRSDGRLQALYVGRVAPEKNLELLIRIFSARPHLQLKVVGEGPYLEQMRLRLPAAEYTGKLTGEQLWRAFADGDIFVFPSLSDTFGNVVRQAHSSGLPAVVTDSLGPREQIEHGINGFVAADEAEFGRYVDCLAADNSLRHRMGAAARAHAEKFTWERVYERLLQYLELARELHRLPRQLPPHHTD
ncbi:MAG: glycosyltransferase [Candidatus Glassbacteria bacterium]